MVLASASMENRRPSFDMGGSSLPCIQRLVDFLHTCRKERNLDLCHRLYIEAHHYGLHSHEVVGNYLVPMLVECGNQQDALLAFRRLPHRNEFSWTALIQGFIDSGEMHQALAVFAELKQDGVDASMFTLQALAKACGRMKCIEKGWELHAEIVKEEFESDLIVGNTLVDMYAKCGLFEEALIVLTDLPTHDTVSWNALISGYVEYGLCEEALRCIACMRKTEIPLDEVTFICGLKCCRCFGDLCKGQGLHLEIIKESFDTYPGIGNSLIDFYARCGLLAEAKDVFDELPERDVVSWNTLITHFAEHGFGEEALLFSEQMRLKGDSPDAITYISSLKGSGSIASVDRTRKIHVEVIKRGFENHSSIGNTLIDAYAKCSSMVEAREVFDNLLVQNVVSWTALISGFSEQGLGNEGLRCWEEMRLRGVRPNAVTLFCSLRNCGLVGAVEKGLEIHIAVVEEGLEKDSWIGSALVDMYAKCGCFTEAEDILEELPVCDVVIWTALTAGYVDQGYGVDSLRCLERMLSDQVLPNIATFLCSMKACGSIQALEKGQELHAMIIKEGWEEDQFLRNAIIDMYAKCGCIGESRDLFDRSGNDSNLVSWNAIISGYADRGLGAEVLNLFEEMKKTGLLHNDITLVCVLKGCGNKGSLEEGREIHSELLKRGYESDCFVGNTLIDMYAKCGQLTEAHDLFRGLSSRADAVSWNALIFGYAEHGHEEEVLILFEQMHQNRTSPNAVTYLCTLKSCAAVASICQGQKIHADIIKNGLDRYPYLGNILVDLYVKCGSLAEASHVFKMLPGRDVIAWTALISGHAESGFNYEALEYVDSMRSEGVSPSSVTFLCSLKGCGCIATIGIGKALHSEIMKYGFEGDPAVGSALVDMYSKVPLMLAEACEVFVRMQLRLIIAWTSLIAAYSEHGLHDEVLDCFEKMQAVDGLTPDAVAYLDSVKACGSLGAMEKGQCMHSCIVKQGMDEEELIAGAVVDMYVKCGLLLEAWTVVFDAGSPTPSIVSWTAIISGFAFHGDFGNVFRLVGMMRCQGIEPDDITLLAILTVCSHAGLVELGCEYFRALTKGHGVDPTTEHHNCLLDLFGRAGQLDESLAMVEDMPIQPNVITYRTFLGACKKWGNAALGKQAFDCAVRLDEQQTAPFVLMSNIYVLADADDIL